MQDRKQRFFNLWAALPERDPQYNALLGQVEGYLGETTPETWELADGQRLRISWTSLLTERGGVRDDGLRIVFERHRPHPQMAVWKPVAPSLVVELHAVSSHVGWPSEGISGAILSHGAWQFRLEFQVDRWVVVGRGELTHDHFYELLTLLLRLDERSPGGLLHEPGDVSCNSSL